MIAMIAFGIAYAILYWLEFWGTIPSIETPMIVALAALIILLVQVAFWSSLIYQSISKHAEA